MSRNIPTVRRWRVTYQTPEETLYLYVSTINKRFARWLSRDEAFRQLRANTFWRATVVVSLAKHQAAHCDDVQH